MGLIIKKVILFLPSQENGNKAHATELDDVISDYFQQRYLPFELAKSTKIVANVNEEGKTVFTIVDAQTEKEIAHVVDSNYLNELGMEMDAKGFFTINETIHHFSDKRRDRK